MKSILWLILPFCTTALVVLAKTNPAQQELLVSEDMMAQHDNRIPGHNDAIYDVVPKEEQVLKIQFLEIAPTPIIADRVFFVYLRGYLPESIRQRLGLLDDRLVNATLTVSLSAVYPDGSRDDEESWTIPFKTMPYNDFAHLTIRDASGVQVDYMPSSDRSDLLLDFQIPTIWLRSGMWTFKVDARAGDANNTCLFAMSLTQWLDGELR
ncbi:hypothetical protein BJX68DRAFT_230012 [Aspergillus pseudodeflectus]|uniref:Uncharacterized protein n=1 Tax=Aspergillus pseudodeflectus TaxID=176178 RepID=A0ABR4KV08_9EURO